MSLLRLIRREYARRFLVLPHVEIFTASVIRNHWCPIPVQYNNEKLHSFNHFTHVIDLTLRISAAFCGVLRRRGVDLRWSARPRTASLHPQVKAKGLAQTAHSGKKHSKVSNTVHQHFPKAMKSAFSGLISKAKIRRTIRRLASLRCRGKFTVKFDDVATQTTEQAVEDPAERSRSVLRVLDSMPPRSATPQVEQDGVTIQTTEQANTGSRLVSRVSDSVPRSVTPHVEQDSVATQTTNKLPKTVQCRIFPGSDLLDRHRIGTYILNGCKIKTLPATNFMQQSILIKLLRDAGVSLYGRLAHIPDSHKYWFSNGTCVLFKKIVLYIVDETTLHEPIRLHFEYCAQGPEDFPTTIKCLRSDNVTEIPIADGMSSIRNHVGPSLRPDGLYMCHFHNLLVLDTSDICQHLGCHSQLQYTNAPNHRKLVVMFAFVGCKEQSKEPTHHKMREEWEQLGSGPRFSVMLATCSNGQRLRVAVDKDNMIM
ncbi:hypothetical protein OPT61_g253 [Boeremia exigua]|uniref:Uncharacterized protein n=1 Tax=Boeremia exigua TaxID=749465 RepID=A0ACC2IUH2_9PLEO|nr:hypothetical protein OPT61_g253 [Boeremia exigua]